MNTDSPVQRRPLIYWGWLVGAAAGVAAGVAAASLLI